MRSYKRIRQANSSQSITRIYFEIEAESLQILRGLFCRMLHLIFENLVVLQRQRLT